MSLLAAAGLHLGELLPPAPDNPRGFFENRSFVEVNRRLLDDADRDWTCPPGHINHRLIDLDPLRAAVGPLLELQRPWGLKDPRTLFTLAAWAPVLGEAQLVGVHRNSADVAKSLASRNSMSYDQALDLALAYAERLAEAHRLLGFPIVSFDATTDVFLDRTARIAELLGLDWNDDSARMRYEVDLVHHRSSSKAINPIDAYLAEAAEAPIDELRTVSPAAVVRLWESMHSGRARSLRQDLGPHQQMVRNRLMMLGIGFQPEVGLVAAVESGGRPVSLPRFDVAPVDRDDFVGGSHPGETRYSHILAPRLLDSVDPDALGALFKSVSEWLTPSGVMVLDGWIVDDEKIQDSHLFQRADSTAFRSSSPFLHHVDQISAFLLDTPLLVADASVDASGRVALVLTNDPRLARATVSPAQLRRRTDELEGSLRMRDAQLADAQATSHMEGQRLQTQIAPLESAIAGANADLTKMRGSRDAWQQRAELAELRTQDFSKERSRLQKEVAALKRTYQRLTNRRLVKLALALARLARPLFRVVRSIRGSRRAMPVPAAQSLSNKGANRGAFEIPSRQRKTKAEVVQGISALRPGSAHSPTGPDVSIIILTRNGAHHLQTLLPSLEPTTYSNFEVIVVDNGSTDETESLLRRQWSFPIKVLRNEHNTSFSDGNNQGVTAASGEILVFINNDLEPVTNSWLAAMVAASTSELRPSAVGSLLVYPDRGDPSTDFTVQHRGISFGFRNGAPHAMNIGGDDPTDPELVGVREVPAVTAAAMLVRRDHFDAVGGFTSGYVYGSEDVDLCLKLGPLGPAVVQGDAVLFHHESATQRSEANDILRINRAGNWQRFAETWGPQLSRSILADRVTGAGSWTANSVRTIAITLTEDDESKGWGDYYTAHQLGDAFAAQGWTVVYAERFEDRWYQLDESVDLIISLLDAYDVRQAPKSAFTLAWVRNWVDRWMSHPWFEHFDSVVASSRKAAEVIDGGSKFSPAVLPLAADPELFHPGAPHPTFKADFTFTGNNWGAGRKIIPLLDVKPDENFLVFGKNWDQDPRMGRYWRGHLPYALLPELYRSVKVVLDDTAGPTLPHAFVNGRVFEALAAGALVLSDNVEGSDELFDGLLPTYSNRFELRRQLDLILGDEDERLRLADELRRIVVGRHTYANRAREFVDVALDVIRQPRIAIKIGAPREEEAHRWGDFHFAHALGRALSHQGFRYEVHLLGQWDDPSHQDVDVVIHIRGLTTYSPKASHINVLWVISHPEDVSPEECRKYDLVFVASRRAVEELSDESVDAVFLPQATDAHRFGTAEPDDGLRTEVLFVGNSRGQNRDAVRWALEGSLPLTLYGAGWDDFVPPESVSADYFPNEDLGGLYASAGVVLNDHWDDMREWGVISNRVFDVLASGGVVVSDQVAGLGDIFGDLVPTYATAEELGQTVTRLLEDPVHRSRISEQARELVLRDHTFDARAATIVRPLRRLLESRRMDCDGGVFKEASDHAGETPPPDPVSHAPLGTSDHL